MDYGSLNTKGFNKGTGFQSREERTGIRAQPKPANPIDDKQASTHVLIVLPTPFDKTYEAAILRHHDVTCETIPFNPDKVRAKLRAASHIILAQGLHIDAENEIFKQIRESHRLRGMLLEFDAAGASFKGKAHIGRFRSREDGRGPPLIVERLFNRSDLTAEAEKITDVFMKLT